MANPTPRPPHLFRITLFVPILALIVLATANPSSAAAPEQSAERPVVVVESYTFGGDTIYPGQEFGVRVRLRNSGQTTARNVVATFTAGEIVPLQTGGSVAIGDLPASDSEGFDQAMTATWDIWGKTVSSILMDVSYSDDVGTAYTASFNLTFPVYTKYVSTTATPTPTATPAQTSRPQLVIQNYAVDVEILEPGVIFSLQLDVENVGNADASRVTMIVGGGSSSGTDAEGTPVPGGTSGGSGDFTHFAPLESSNIQSLGDLDIDQVRQAEQPLIVNVSTSPGAYPMRITFTYVDERGRIYIDDQVITLLVYSVPKLDVDFYQDPGMFFAGQFSGLPLQVINTGKNTAVLGNMRVTAEGADITNNITLIGFLDAGGYYPLDAQIVPYSPGPLELTVTIDYTNDFNQPQQYVETLVLDVQEAPVMEPIPGDPGMEPGMNGGEGMPGAEENLWQKIVRFFKGLFGLGSEVAEPGMDGGMPVEEMPVEVKPMKGP